MKKFGSIYGLCLGLLSLGLVFSFIGGVIPLLIANKLGDILSALTGISETTSTMIICIVAILIGVIAYFSKIIKRKAPTHLAFAIGTLILLIFLNALIALLQSNLGEANVTMETELTSITATFATSWIYVILGVLHDIYRNKLEAKTQI